MGEIVAADMTSAASDVVQSGDNYTSSISAYAASPIRDYVLVYLSTSKKSQPFVVSVFVVSVFVVFTFVVFTSMYFTVHCSRHYTHS